MLSNYRQYVAGFLAFATLYVIRYSLFGGIIMASSSVIVMVIRKKLR